MLGLIRNKQVTKPKNINRGRKWSIGLYAGDPLGELVELPGNPIIAAEDITDCRAGFVADPFIIEVNNIYYLFFEIMNLDSGQGDIGLSISEDGVNWSYQGLVLVSRYHLSYPWVFEHRGNYFMLPEMNQGKTVKLFQAVNFPYEWESVAELLSGKRYRDSSLLKYDSLWWLFTTWDDTRLHLYYSEDLLSGSWQSHPASPVARGRFARPAGRILNYNGRFYRPAQDPLPGYGSRVMLHEIEEISTDSYKERLIGPYFSASRSGWNSERMHHVDFLDRIPAGIKQKGIVDEKDWLVVADGYNTRWTIDPVRLSISRVKRRLRNVRDRNFR
ncbi:hypothetical protein I0Q91_12035 [Halanaerobiaceae bacterium Z-7014]|uniref:Glucosamine inositolphosphorylceramide transferase 1 N-terminal domain-containing protein n=1 Tax=Halonatronomonas betaini TaxID=2778430 RepID=A0A931FBC1_9FIRM|nr:hypothetical protein [Halonatronomonas betaini]MBF8437817.1 hypothetical protein [Halonatronomonas betaini]